MLFRSKYVKNPLRDVLDGTSNTLMLGEAAGAPEVYIRRKPMTLPDYTAYVADGGDKVTNAISGRYVLNGGTGWADPDRGYSINGSKASGAANGPIVMNYFNGSEAYSFHPGGCVFTRADGSTDFVNQNVSPQVFAARVTRAGGEVNTDSN